MGRNRVSTPEMWIQVPWDGRPRPCQIADALVHRVISRRRLSRCPSHSFHRFRLGRRRFLPSGCPGTSRALGLFSVDQLKRLEGRSVGGIGHCPENAVFFGENSAAGQDLGMMLGNGSKQRCPWWICRNHLCIGDVNNFLHNRGEHRSISGCKKILECPLP